MAGSPRSCHCLQWERMRAHRTHPRGRGPLNKGHQGCHGTQGQETQERECQQVSGSLGVTHLGFFPLTAHFGSLCGQPPLLLQRQVCPKTTSLTAGCRHGRDLAVVMGVDVQANPELQQPFCILQRKGGRFGGVRQTPGPPMTVERLHQLWAVTPALHGREE